MRFLTQRQGYGITPRVKPTATTMVMTTTTTRFFGSIIQRHTHTPGLRRIMHVARCVEGKSKGLSFFQF